MTEHHRGLPFRNAKNASSVLRSAWHSALVHLVHESYQVAFNELDIMIEPIFSGDGHEKSDFL
jgi:hypothetical protein